MRTVPRIVLRALAETSGTTRCTTSTVPEPGSAAAGLGAAAGVEDGSLPGTDNGGFVLLAAESAAALFSAAAAAEGFAAAGGRLAGRELVAGEGEVELSVLRNMRGTISAARTSVPPAPIRKYFNDPPEARGLGIRRGAAIVTFTLGSEETGICDGALGRSKPGETGESGTESGSTAGDAAGDTRDLAPPADAWAAAARGGRAAAVSGSGARGAAIASTRASGVGAATGLGLGT